jgi:hypothetical protein
MPGSDHAARAGPTIAFESRRVNAALSQQGQLHCCVPELRTHVSEELGQPHPFMPKSREDEHQPSGALARWRARASERRKQRLLSSRRRSSLAASARRAAECKSSASRRTVLLQDRAAAVSDGLLEIALVLKHADDLDASWVFAIHKLLTDECESPLYNRDLHMSELRATLLYLRGGREIQ